jgi:hypothetical protein
MITDEEMFRNVAADSMAQGFVVEILLAAYLKPLLPQDRVAALKAIEEMGKKTGHFTDLAKDDDRAAEKFADVVIKMHAALDGLLYRAARRVLAD